MTLFLAALVATAFCVFVFVIYPKWERKRELKRRQTTSDHDIERRLMFQFVTDVDALALHSDIDKISTIVSARLKDLIENGIAPASLYKILKEMGIRDIVIDPRSDADKLRAHIQGYIHRTVDSYILECYMLAASRAKSEDFKLLNNTFLTKAPKNMLIWSPTMN